MPDQTEHRTPLDLESVRGMIARATLYARDTFKDGIREPDQAMRSAYNLIVYGAPQLLAEVRRIAAERDQLRRTVAEVRALHQQYRTAWTDEYDVCSHCTTGMDLVRWPCPTIQAINGEAGRG